MAPVLGIDIGGSGIKGALVDSVTGALLHDRVRLSTPQPATPTRVAEVVAELMGHFDWSGPTGATFPAVIQHGVALTAANVAKSWIGSDVAGLLSTLGHGPVTVINDADAAGLAEARFGAGRDVSGTVLMLTFGTGIGSALLVDGHLVPNTEFGHLELDGVDAERQAADSAREREELSWSKWAKRVQRYLRHVEMLLNPDLFIIGGGASKRAEKWLGGVSVATPVRIAELLNSAGVVGAAMAAANRTLVDPTPIAPR